MLLLLRTAFIVVLSLSGCGGGGEGTPSPSSTAVQSSAVDVPNPDSNTDPTRWLSVSKWKGFITITETGEGLDNEGNDTSVNAKSVFSFVTVGPRGAIGAPNYASATGSYTRSETKIGHCPSSGRATFVSFTQREQLSFNLSDSDLASDVLVRIALEIVPESGFYVISPAVFYNNIKTGEETLVSCPRPPPQQPIPTSVREINSGSINPDSSLALSQMHIALPEAGFTISGNHNLEEKRDDGITIHYAVSWTITPFVPELPEYSLVLRTFIPYETIIGPGALVIGEINQLYFGGDLVAATLAAAAASADGMTCGYPPNVAPLLFEGDNRSFSFDVPRGNYRAESKIKVSFDRGKFPNGIAEAAAFDTGVSRSFAPNALDTSGALSVAAKSDIVLNDCSLLHREGQLAPGTGLSITVDVVSDTIISVHFVGRAPNPIVHSAGVFAPIKWDVTVAINNREKQFAITGNSTCFPAFELYLNGAHIFTNMPSNADPVYSGGCLSGVLPSVDWATGPAPLP